LADCFSLERVDPETLRGCVVLVEDSELDQRIIKHHLRQTQLRLRTAGSVAEGLRLISEGCDLILCDFDLPDGSAADLLTTLVDRGVRIPSIVTTSDISTLTRRGLRQVNASAFLAKPIQADLLMRAVAEFLVMDRKAGPLGCSLAPDDPAAPLAEAFVSEMRGFAKELAKTIESGDWTKARRICLRIAGTAPSVGFHGIADLAGAAAKDLAGSSSTAESSTPLRAVISACERARPPESQNQSGAGRGPA
jgi:CheY-like chemotaxis protein